MKKEIYIHYFASLKEASGKQSECLVTEANTPEELYAELCKKYNFVLPKAAVKVAINDHYEEMNAVLKDGTQLSFIPPVSGG